MSIRRFIVSVLLLSAAFVQAAADELAQVNESSRAIPVAYQVDVVVVGGSTGAVAAAVQAARAGAKVFLAAPYPYLGDDMAGTLRLWLEPGEKPDAPLARTLFDDPIVDPDLPDANRMPFSYQADVPSASPHKDTDPPSVLTNGAWFDPVRETVQYDSDVNITADLQAPKQIREARVQLHQQSPGPKSYRAASVTIYTSDDQKTWKQAAVLEPAQSTISGSLVTISAPLGTTARYVKFLVKKDANAARVLLGEIEIIAPAPAAAPRDPSQKPMPRPMYVKKTLDDALVSAGVSFLYNCYATDVLRDTAGQPCGIVMANRAGRQAVVAKIVVDATERAQVARLAGAHFRPFPAGTQSLQRVVIGGEVQNGPGMTARTIAPPFRGPHPNPAGTSSGTFQVIEYTLSIPMADDSFASWAKADQIARRMTYHPEQQFTSDLLFQVPPDAMIGEASDAGPWQGVDRLPLESLRPKGVQRLLVLGGCADVSRQQAKALLRPPALIDLGTRVGAAAAEEAGSLPAPEGVMLPGRPAPNPAAEGDVYETLVGVRPTQKLPTIPQDGRAVPVLGKYDVVIIGGGTAGAPAATGAARQGASTLVVECLHGMGGVGTLGAISKHYYGYRVGFTAEVEGGASWVIEQKMEWYRRELEKAGAHIWFGAIGCGALVQDRRVAGVVVATPQGRGVVLAGVVIDATGNADVAAAAGAETVYTDDREFAMQGTGLPYRQLGATYTNTDFTYTDETDLVDIWQLFVGIKDKYARFFDLGQLVDTRERRRIVGDFTVTFLDQVMERTYPDTIVHTLSNYDSHGYVVDPYLLLRHPLRRVFQCDLPYRCLLPKGLDGILVSGIGVSAHRDALPIIRMQPDVQNQGYAAGVAAALAVKDGVTPRQLDVRKLQYHLVEIGNLPERVLADLDSYPLPAKQIETAVRAINDDPKSAAVILAHADQSLPLVKAAYAQAEGDKKVFYAKILGMMDDATGLATLLAELEKASEWDEVPSWLIDEQYAGHLQVGRLMSHLDNTLVAIGRTGRLEAVPAVLEKLALLKPSTNFSHHRAVYLALEMLGDPRAARPLAELLQQKGMHGYAQTALDPKSPPGASRSESVRELALARALYRTGDYQGLGEKTLREYANDLRGHFARHAEAVLAAGKRSKS